MPNCWLKWKWKWVKVYKIKGIRFMYSSSINWFKCGMSLSICMIVCTYISCIKRKEYRFSWLPCEPRPKGRLYYFWPKVANSGGIRRSVPLIQVRPNIWVSLRQVRPNIWVSLIQVGPKGRSLSFRSASFIRFTTSRSEGPCIRKEKREKEGFRSSICI